MAKAKRSKTRGRQTSRPRPASPGEPLQLTRTSDVVIPVRLIELSSMRTRSGAPVVIQCERVHELLALDILQRLPGPVIAAVKRKANPSRDELAVVMKVAPSLIEAGTMMLGPNGEEVRPAISFADDPGPSLPGRLLGDLDRTRILRTILALGGYIPTEGGPPDPEDARFPGRDGAGGGEGATAGAAGEADGDVAPGGAPGSRPAV